MAKDKSILEKFSDAVKGLADSASQALKAEEPARVDETSAAYMPLAADGLVSDPLLVPPVATQPPRRKRRVAKKTAAPRGARKSVKKAAAKKSAPKKSARKAVKKSASAKSKQVAKTTKRRAGAGKSAPRKGR
jgi:hypothetical protein